jgi:hypothetical protein
MVREVMTLRRTALALSLSLLSSTALAAGTIKSGHVLGNATGAERTPQDTAVVPVLQQSGSGAGAGVGTALGVPVGTAGSVVVNGGALGTPSSGTLSNATGLPPTGLAVPSGVQGALADAPNTSGGMVLTPSSPGGYYFGPAGGPTIVPVYDLMAYGGSPSNSASANAIALQSVYTAIGSGSGIAHIPCGQFAIGVDPNTSAQPIMTVGANAHFGQIGDGIGCAVLNYQGSIDGTTLVLTNANSSFELRGFTNTTNTTNTQKAFNIALTNGSGTTYAGQSLIENVAYNGSDFTSSSPNANYWQNGIWEEGVNNLTIRSPLCNGANAAGGLLNHQYTDCIVVQGSGVGGNLAAGAYSVVINVHDMIAANCNSGVKINDYVQGVALDIPNITACGRGMWIAPTAPVGYLTEFVSHGGQYYTTVFALDVEDPQAAGVIFTGNQMAAGAGQIAKMQGAQYVFDDNNLACNTTNGTIGYNAFSGYGQGGTVGNNNVSGCGVAFNVPASANPFVNFNYNHPVGNGYGAINVVAAASATVTVSGWTPTQPITLGAIFEGMTSQFTMTQAAGVMTVTTAPVGGPALAVGQTIYVPGFTTETIPSLGSGSGSIGTYNMSVSQTVSTPETASNNYATPPSVSAYVSASPSSPNGTYTLNQSGTYSGAATVQWLDGSPFDYVIGASASTVKISDKETRLFTMLPPWSAAILGSDFDAVSDLATSTYNATVSSGGSTGIGKLIATSSAYVLR